MKRLNRAFLAAAALTLSTQALADPQAPTGETIAAFTAAPRLIEIAPGRRLALRCMGSGPQTVLFEAGGSDWSVIWALVQPAVAGRATACSYDRAGLGQSDAADLPRSPVAIVEDLHALIASAGLTRPLVLVGHSLGGFNVKLHAALYPGDVSGLVLVDPAEERSWDRTREDMEIRFGRPLAGRAELLDQTWRTQFLERYRACAGETPATGLEPGSRTFRDCTDPPRPMLGSRIEGDRARVLVTRAFQAAQSSEILNSVYGAGANDALYARLFKPNLLREKPVIVLTHGRFDANDPLDVLDHHQILLLHRQTARLSRWGQQRTVAGTGHNIQLTRPDAIVEAIGDVLDDLR